MAEYCSAECRLCWVSFVLSVTYAEYHICLLSFIALIAECRYVECRYAKCRDAVKSKNLDYLKNKSPILKTLDLDE